MELYLHKDEIEELSEKISSVKKLFNLLDKLKEQGVTFDCTNNTIHIVIKDKLMIEAAKPEYEDTSTAPQRSLNAIDLKYNWHNHMKALVMLYLDSISEYHREDIIREISSFTDYGLRGSQYIINRLTMNHPSVILTTAIQANALKLKAAIEKYDGCKCSIVYLPKNDQSEEVLKGTQYYIKKEKENVVNCPF